MIRIEPQMLIKAIMFVCFLEIIEIPFSSKHGSDCDCSFLGVMSSGINEEERNNAHDRMQTCPCKDVALFSGPALP